MADRTPGRAWKRSAPPIRPALGTPGQSETAGPVRALRTRSWPSRSRSRKRPASRCSETKKANKEIKKPDHALVVLDRGGFVRGSGDQRSLELLTVSDQFIADLGPKPGAPQALGDLNLGIDGHAVNGDQEVAGTNTGPGSRRVRS